MKKRFAIKIYLIFQLDGDNVPGIRSVAHNLLDKLRENTEIIRKNFSKNVKKT